MPGMDDKPVKRGSGGGAAVAAIVLIVIVLPLIYLLAIGPIVWLSNRGYVSVEPDSFIGRVYYPAEMLAQESPPFARAVQTYVSLWQSPPPVQIPPVTLPPVNAAQLSPAPAAAPPSSASTGP